MNCATTPNCKTWRMIYVNGNQAFVWRINWSGRIKQRGARIREIEKQDGDISSAQRELTKSIQRPNDNVTHVIDE